MFAQTIDFRMHREKFITESSLFQSLWKFMLFVEVHKTSRKIVTKGFQQKLINFLNFRLLSSAYLTFNLNDNSAAFFVQSLHFCVSGKRVDYKNNFFSSIFTHIIQKCMQQNVERNI